MFTLFDEKYIYDTHFRSVAKEHEAIGEARGEARGEAIGEKNGGIKMTIKNYHKLGQSKESTINALIEEFKLSKEEAEERVNEAWD